MPNSSSKKTTDKPATLKDVAELAGVTHSTVSRVINHPEIVNPKTREKIWQCIRDLDYQPNPFARGLQTSLSGMIALVVPSITNLAFANFARGVQSCLEQNESYGLTIASSDENCAKEQSICLMLRQHWVDGVIFVSSAGGIPPIELLPQKMAKVLVERSCKSEDIDTYQLDLDEGVKKACEHLYGLGHSKIAIILGDSMSITSKERLKSFKKALNVLELSYRNEYIEKGMWTSWDAKAAMIRLLHLEDPPTAVFAITDTMAMGAIAGAAELGLNVPMDVSIIGFNNELGSAEYNPPLTTLDTSSFEMGRDAAETLLRRVGEPGRPSVEIMYSTKLLIRASTAPPKKL
ncbi:MAG: hypothetical protein APF76_06465 [Desulfitibacter sp. BRH_c19]|nr:MAG: hypothetical protein APF76_06465 [Desulfitibacter sp. BRH_c19]